MGGRHPSDGKPTKTEIPAQAGISTSTTHRYEELVGGTSKKFWRIPARTRSEVEGRTGKHFVRAPQSAKRMFRSRWPLLLRPAVRKDRLQDFAAISVIAATLLETTRVTRGLERRCNCAKASCALYL